MEMRPLQQLLKVKSRVGSPAQSTRVLLFEVLHSLPLAREPPAVVAAKRATRNAMDIRPLQHLLNVEMRVGRRGRELRRVDRWMGRHGKGVFGVVLLDEGTQLEIFSVEELDSIKRLGIYSNFPAAAREIALAYIVALSRRFELSLRFSFSASPPFPTQTPNPLLFSFVPLVLTPSLLLYVGKLLRSAILLTLNLERVFC